MQIQFSLDIKHSVLLEEDVIRDIADFLSQQYNEMSYKLTCADEAMRKTDDLAEVLSFDNADHHQIRRLVISARTSYTDECTFVINASPYQACTVDINAESQQKADHVKSFILDKLNGSRFPAFHDLISKHPYLSSFLISILIASLLISIMILFNLSPFKGKGGSASSKGFLASNPNLIALFIVLPLLSFKTDSLKDSLFPRIFINLNRQQRRLERIYKTREILFVVILLGFVLSIAANFVSNRIM